MPRINIFLLIFECFLIRLIESELILLSKQNNATKTYFTSCVATGNNANSSIAWFESGKPANLTTYKDTNEIVININHPDIFKTVSSLTKNLPLIHDERWEDFKLIRLKHQTEHKITNNGQPIFGLTISVFLLNDLEVNLKNNFSVIYHFVLSNLNTKTKSNAIIIPFNTWTHVNLVINEEKINIFINNETLPRLDTLNNKTIEEISLQSNGDDNFCKIQKYEVLEMKEKLSGPKAIRDISFKGSICINAFIAIGANCTATIRFDFNPNPVTNKYTFKNNGNLTVWKKIEVHSENHKVVQINIEGKFTLHTIAILKKCSLDYRTSSVLNENANGLICANIENTENVSLSNIVTETKEEKSCINNMFGKFCNLSYASFPNLNSTNYQRICDSFHHCHCLNGYTGSNCAEQCPRNKWGKNCKYDCGNCNNSSCDITSGHCLTDCVSGYYGKFCKRTYEKLTMKLVNVNYTTVTVESHIPLNINKSKIFCQYKDINETIELCNISYVRDMIRITLKNLKPVGKYNIFLLEYITNTNYDIISNLSVNTCFGPPNLLTGNLESNNSFLFKWNLSSLTKEPIQQVNVSLKIFENEENSTYYRNDLINVTDCRGMIQLNSSTTYNISIKPINKMDCLSDYTVIDTFPSEPSISFTFVKNSNTSCHISLHSLKKTSRNCSLYVIGSKEINQIYYTEDSDILTYAADQLNTTQDLQILHNASINLNSDILNVKMTNCVNAEQLLGIIIVSSYKGRDVKSFFSLCVIDKDIRKTGENESNTLIVKILVSASALFIIMLTIIIYLLFLNCRKRNNASILNLIYSNAKQELLPFGSSTNITRMSNAYETPLTTLSKPVNINDLQKYIEENVNTNEFEIQYNSLPKGFVRSYSSSQTNRRKNRYQNVHAYDHSRVILESSESDYINANFINGYNCNNAYIATQAPKTNTVNDFWRMVFQYNIQYIVMLIDLIENGKKNCEQYWPEEHKTLSTKDFTIENIKTNIQTSLICRQLKVIHKSENIIVNHYQFVNWSECVHPIFTQMLLRVINILQKFQKVPPVVIHCSTGVHRTGTIILCDIAIQMIEKTGIVDFPKILTEMLQQRMCLISIEQYILAHLFIYEFYFKSDFCLSVDREFRNEVNVALKNNVAKRILKYINLTSWQTQINQNKLKKDEMKDISLQISAETLQLFNITIIDRTHFDKPMVSTKYPLEEQNIFWKLVFDNDIQLVINLNEVNNKKQKKFWPECVCDPKVFHNITVEFDSESKYDSFSVKKLFVKNTEENGNKYVYVISVTGWKSSQLVPTNVKMLFNIQKECINLIGSSNTPIVAVCSDGTTASGLFVSMILVVEMLKLEHKLDVCLIIQILRQYNRKFVNHKKQVEFLYTSACTYLELFDDYSNFVKV